MNFTDLYKKVVELDNPLAECAECGNHPEQPEQPKQQDTVYMNVSLTGQGTNGIRDLMNILRNIDDAPSQEPSHDDKIVIGDGDTATMPLDDSYENSVDGSSEENVYDMSAVLPTGDDMNSKGKEAVKQAGGGNPWNINETVLSNLQSLYDEVKKKSINENNDLPGYGDEETWPKSYIPKTKHHGSYDDERIPGTGSQQDIEGDIVDKRNQEREQHRKQVKNTYVDKEGIAPNGEKYNKIYVIKATNKRSAEHEVHLFDKHEWGAKKIVDQKIKQDDDGSVMIALFIVDKHKYGMWRPWKDEPPTSKPLSFN